MEHAFLGKRLNMLTVTDTLKWDRALDHNHLFILLISYSGMKTNSL